MMVYTPDRWEALGMDWSNGWVSQNISELNGHQTTAGAPKSEIYRVPILVGGWTNPFEKY